jgi:hypothetical protein
MDLETYDTDVCTNGNVLTLTIRSSRTILEDELSNVKKDDEIDCSAVDKVIKEFNKSSNDLIVDYNFESINKNTIIICVLLKQAFKKFGEVQRYVNYKVTFDEKNKTTTFVLNKGEPIVTIPSGCKHAPFNKVVMTNTKADNINVSVIDVTFDDDISTYKNYNMILDYTTGMLRKIYSSVNKYISVAKNA